MVHSLSKVCMTETNKKLYKEEINWDDEYKKVIRNVQTKWPPYHQLSGYERVLHKFKHELHVEGLLLKDYRLVVPNKLTQVISKSLHAPF